MTFIESIERGMQGGNEGRPHGLGRANRALYGVQRGTYYLIGAESGCGKATFADYCFVLSPYFEVIAKNREPKIKWIYYSLEISKQEKMYTWMSYLLDMYYNIQVDRNTIKGVTRSKLSEETFKLVMGLYPVMEKMFDYIDFKDDWASSDTIYSDLMKYAENNGKFTRMENMITGYEPNDDSLFTIIVVDHLALITEKPGQTLKKAMDTTSLHMRYFRNRCNFTPVMIQQFNSEMGSIDRQKYKASALAPKREDFGDSRYTYRDADVVIGGIKPFDYDIPEYKGYRIFGSKALQDSVTFWHVIKNRYVGSRAIIPLQRGTVPKFRELPPPNVMNYG